MSEGSLKIDVRGEELVLLPERAVHWPAQSALLIADPHWGKAATFRAHGIPVPSGTTDEGIARLDRVVRRTGSRQWFFLGICFTQRQGDQMICSLRSVAGD